MKAVDITTVKKGKDDFEDMYKDLTDKDRIAENKRKAGIKKHLKDKKTDTGL